MNLSSALLTLGFFSIFHVIGGAAIGAAARRLRHGFGCNSIFFLVWGAIFGCAPLLVGASEFERMGTPFLIVAQFLVFISAILIAAFVPDTVLETFRSQNIILILFGGAFLIAGFAVGAFTFREAPFVASVMILVFGGVGAAILASGLRGLLKEK